MNTIKKLVNYSYDCIRQSIKANSFNNLNSNKDNQVLIINDNAFNGDNKEIIELMTKHALNKTTMVLLYSDLFIKKENKIFTPLLYNECNLIRECDKIKLETEEEKTLNIGVIANLMNNEEEEKIELIINQLMDVENSCDLPTVMNGLLNMRDVEIIKQKAIILTKMPESTAGVLNELKQIAELY